QNESSPVGTVFAISIDRTSRPIAEVCVGHCLDPHLSFRPCEENTGGIRAHRRETRLQWSIQARAGQRMRRRLRMKVSVRPMSPIGQETRMEASIERGDD